MSLFTVINNYDVFLIDVWGVIYDGVRFYEHVFEKLSTLQKHNKKVVIVSNSTALSDEIRENLKKGGLDIEKHYNYLVTSGTVMRDYVSKLKKVRIKQILKRNNSIFAGLSNVMECSDDDTNIDYVYIGIVKYNGQNIDLDDLLDTEGNKIKLDQIIDCDWNNVRNSQGEYVLREINHIIMKTKVPMLCANSDTFSFNAGNTVMTQGMVALKYERNGGRVIYSGKPYSMIYEYTFQNCDISPEKDRIVMIGDTPWTDIAGANMVKIDSILVKSGSYATFLKNTKSRDTEQNMSVFLNEFSLKAFSTKEKLNFLPTWITEEKIGIAYRLV